MRRWWVTGDPIQVEEELAVYRVLRSASQAGPAKPWAWSRIGQLGRYINGRAFKPSEWETRGLPIIRIQNLNDQSAKFNYTTAAHDERFRVRSGDLLISWAASLGVYI